MQLVLDDAQIAEIKQIVFSVVKDGIKQVGNQRPFLNRRDIAKYFGVSESTISYWASLGMPVAVVDGRKLYGKKSITQWRKAHETRLQGQENKPVTIGVVTSNK